MNLSCFEGCDIRGKFGDELNEEITYRIGRAYAEHMKPRKVGVGADVRLTSEAVKLPSNEILAHLAPLDPEIDHADVISLEFPDFRSDVRRSNTELLLGLSVETRHIVEAAELHLRRIERPLCE